MKFHVQGMILKRDVDYGYRTTLMAHGDIALPEIRATIKGVSLCHRGGEFVAFAPRPGKENAGIQWDIGGPFAQALAVEMIEMFKRMGGDMPPATPEKAENRANARQRMAEKRQDQVTGKPIGADPFDKPEKIERRIVPAVFKVGTVDGRPIDDAVAEADELIEAMGNAEDDLEGLHAFLGVSPAVSETMEQAGL